MTNSLSISRSLYGFVLAAIGCVLFLAGAQSTHAQFSFVSDLSADRINGTSPSVAYENRSVTTYGDVQGLGGCAAVAEAAGLSPLQELWCVTTMVFEVTSATSDQPIIGQPSGDSWGCYSFPCIPQAHVTVSLFFPTRIFTTEPVVGPQPTAYPPTNPALGPYDCSGRLAANYDTGPVFQDCYQSHYDPDTEPSPDLVASAVGPTTAAVGAPVTFTATVTNIGGAAVSGTFPNFFQIQPGTGEVFRVTNTVSNLAAGASASITATGSYTFATAGTYQVRACADSGSNWASAVSESNESNNCGPLTTITVGNSALPDLTASGVTPTTATVGTPVTLQATISNAGTQQAVAPFPNLFQIDMATDVYRFRDIVTNLAASAATTISASATYTFTSAGDYPVRACADSGSGWSSSLVESNEANNCSPSWTIIHVCAAGQTWNGSACVGGELPTCTFSASPTNSVPSTLTWSSTNATSCTGGGFSTGNATSGTATVNTAGTYTLSCTGTGGSCTKSVTVGGACTGTPSVDITATPNRVRANPNGTPFTLSWSGTNVSGTCSITGSDGSTIPVGSPSSCTLPGGTSAPRTIETQTTYTIRCGSATDSVTVNVIPKFDEF